MSIALLKSSSHNYRRITYSTISYTELFMDSHEESCSNRHRITTDEIDILSYIELFMDSDEARSRELPWADELSWQIVYMDIDIQ